MPHPYYLAFGSALFAGVFISIYERNENYVRLLCSNHNGNVANTSLSFSLLIVG